MRFWCYEITSQTVKPSCCGGCGEGRTAASATTASAAELFAERYDEQPQVGDSLDVGKFADLPALKRIAKVEEQAKAAAFLLTDDSSYVTGQSLRVDGGVTKHI